MSQKIAELYASLRFDVETAALAKFREVTQEVRKEMGGFLKDTATFNRRMKVITARFRELNSSFNARDITEWRKRLIASMNRYEEVLKNAKKEMDRFAEEVQLAGTKLNWFDDRMQQNIASLTTYRTVLEPVVSLMERLRAAQGSPLPRVGGGASGGGGVQGVHTGQRASGSAAGGLAQAAGIGAFLRPLMPTGMGLGGMLGAGYGFREMVLAGRELQAMEFKLKAVSESAEVFNSNLKFVRETSRSLAIDITEFGQSYASIFQSAKQHASLDQVQEMTMGMNKYFRTLQMTPDQIKGSLRAVGQMLNKEKVLAEELTGQLGERAAGVLNIFAEAANTDVKGLFKMMQDGKVGNDVVLKAGQLMGDWADKQGTLNDALKTSTAKQTLFNNSLKQMSKVILESGLDQALADLFTALVPVVEVVGKALAVIVSYIVKLIGGVKFLYNYLQEHPVHASFIAASSAVAILIKLFTMWRLVAGTALVRLIFLAGLLNKQLLIMKASALAVRGAFVALLYLFSQIDGYNKGEKDNIFFVWYNAVQLLIASIRLMFAELEYGWLRTKQWAKGSFLAKSYDAAVNWTSDVVMPLVDKAFLTPSLDAGGSPYIQPTASSVTNNNMPNVAVKNEFHLSLGDLSNNEKKNFFEGKEVIVPIKPKAPTAPHRGQ